MDRSPESGGSGVSPAGRRALRVVARDGQTVGAPRRSGAGPSPPPVSPADLPLDDMIAQVLTGCLDQFETHAPALRANDGGAEAVHRLRVSLRRMRALLGLLRDRVPDPALAEAAYRAKALARALGPARDWHVFRESMELPSDVSPERDHGFYPFLDAVELRRFHALAGARAAIDSRLARDFVRDLRRAILRRSWRECAPGLREPGSARRFAVKTLERLRRRAAKRCEGLAKKSPERRHRARIVLKKARYAGEFFEPLFDADSRAYLRDLAKIQDRLGHDNDLKTADTLLREIELFGPSSAETEARRRREKLAGARRESLEGLEHVEERVRSLRPFWR